MELQNLSAEVVLYKFDKFDLQFKKKQNVHQGPQINLFVTGLLERFFDHFLISISYHQKCISILSQQKFFCRRLLSQYVMVGNRIKGLSGTDTWNIIK